MTPTRIHVLHVVDRIGGGAPVAAASFIRNSPSGFRHSVLTPFPDGKPPELWSNLNADLLPLAGGLAAGIRDVRAAIRALQPDTVHAHSSFAGAFARLAAPRSRPRIVYSPHCFGFERRDIGPLTRFMLRSAEWTLGWRTDVLAACSPAEQAISERLHSLNGKAVFLPNVPSVTGSISAELPGPDAPIRIAMIGRLTRQKDPAYFIDVVERLRAHRAVVAEWFGDGPEDIAQDLEERGIRVSGWMTPEELSSRLRDTHIYVHGAAWEGFPLAVLDAHAHGLPMLVRDISAFAGADDEMTWERGSDALIAALSSADAFRKWHASNRRGWSAYLAQNTSAMQQSRLTDVWSASAHPRPEPAPTKREAAVD